MNGFRSDKVFDKNNLKNSIITIGDSTSYGLNINNNKTYTSLLRESSNIEDSINLSYPGLNLNSIVYKLGCLNEILNKKNIQNNTTIISLYYNDIEGLDSLPFTTEKCDSLNQISLLNAYLTNEYEKDLVEDNKSNKVKIFSKLKNFKKYPYYLDRLICKKLFEQSCSLIKFSLGNLNLKFKSYIFGNHNTNGLYENIKKTDKEKLIFLEKNLKMNIIRNSEISKKTILFYIPRYENDLTSQIKNKKEKGFSIYIKIFVMKLNQKKNIFCIDGSEIIINSLSNFEILNLKKGGRLPDKYYSYLDMYDMGHPSEYLSELYKKRILQIIDKKRLNKNISLFFFTKNKIANFMN